MDLDQVLNNVKGNPVVPQRPAAGSPIKSVSWTHDNIIDFMLANPFMKQDQIALHIGYSATWLSNIIRSGAFKARMAERKAELLDPALMQTVEEQFEGVVHRSLEVIRHHLDKPAPDVPFAVAAKALEVSGRCLGYGVKKEEPRDPVSVHVHLETMADNMTVLLRKRREVIQGESIESETHPAASEDAEGRDLPATV